MTHRLLIKNVSVAQMADKGAGYDLLSDAALLVEGDKIAWVGPVAEVDPALTDVTTIDGKGRLRITGRVKEIFKPEKGK